MSISKAFVPWTGSKRAAQYARHILYQDKSIIVLNKQPGLVCQGKAKDPTDHKEADEEEPTRHDDFTQVLHDLKKRLDMPVLPYPVHRLDKVTTGALVFAKSLPRARDLGQQFQSRTVEKTYLALVRGGSKTFSQRHGEIRAPLAFTDGRVMMARRDGGKRAETDWEVIATSDKVPVSLLRLRLHTGLKHQLRVHLAQTLNTPVLGDSLYCKTPLADSIKLDTTVPQHRVMLHASNVSFFRYRSSGPQRRFRLGITAPLPKDFLAICEDLDFLVDETAPDFDSLEELNDAKLLFSGKKGTLPPKKIRGLTRREVDGGVFIDGIHLPEGEVPELEGRWMKKRFQVDQDMVR